METKESNNYPGRDKDPIRIPFKYNIMRNVSLLNNVTTKCDNKHDE